MLQKLVSVLKGHKLEHEIFYTERDKNGTVILEQHFNENFTDLIILGGDGTLNEAVNGLKYDTPISIIPTGSGNDYVKCLNLGQSLEDQIETALFGQVMRVDLGLCNGRKFLNGVGVGFDGQIVADMVREKTMIKGPAKYYYHVLKILASYAPKSFSFTDDHGTHKKKLILLCIAKGTTFGGSFKLNPEAKLADGFLHVCEVGELHPIKRFLSIPALSKGKHGRLKEVRFFKTNSLIIENQTELNAHIDGEYFGNPPFKFSVMEKALQVRVKA